MDWIGEIGEYVDNMTLSDLAYCDRSRLEL